MRLAVKKKLDLDKRIKVKKSYCKYHDSENDNGDDIDCLYLMILMMTQLMTTRVIMIIMVIW